MIIVFKMISKIIHELWVGDWEEVISSFSIQRTWVPIFKNNKGQIIFLNLVSKKPGDCLDKGLCYSNNPSQIMYSVFHPSMQHRPSAAYLLPSPCSTLHVVPTLQTSIFNHLLHVLLGLPLFLVTCGFKWKYFLVILLTHFLNVCPIQRLCFFHHLIWRNLFSFSISSH